VQLLDAAGNAYNAIAPSVSAAQGRFAASIHFQPRRPGGGNPAGEPARLVWTIPAETTLVDVPVEFKDLPIP
jgi:hypothetical protein